MKTAVIAGTPIDTQMGVDFLRGKGVDAMLCPCAEDPRACHIFQMLGAAEKEAHMDAIFSAAKAAGAENYFVYCNSLSGAFDYDDYGRRKGFHIVTPMNAYAKLAAEYGKIGVIAANSQATCGIEKAFTAVRPDCYVLGLGILSLVEAVESKLAPEEIVRRFKLAELSAWFRENGAEAMLLGCTHYPYFKDALKAVSVLPVIDPAEEMYKLLTQKEK